MTEGTVFTVGHGTRPLEELVSTLREADVQRLVDVRRFPGSRRHPWFSRASLEEALPNGGIAYAWRGDTLGGRRRAAPKSASRHPAWRVDAFRAYAEHMDTEEFQRALADLEGSARRGARLAVLCSETLWWRCHRRLIADALVLHGFDVVHLLGPGKRQPHKLHDDVRRDDEGRPVYDGGQSPLPLFHPAPARDASDATEGSLKRARGE